MEQTKKKFLKKMVGFSMMTWITFIIGFIASPLATRLFNTFEKGRIDMFLNYAAMYGSACYLGLDQAFVRFYHEPPGGATRKSLFTFCAVVPLCFGAVGALALSPLWPSVSGRVNDTPDLAVFICLCLYCATPIAYRFLSLNYRMEQNARSYTILGVLYALITKLSYLAVGFFVPTGKAAILSLTITMGLFTLVSLWAQRDRYGLGSLRAVSAPFVKSVAAFAAPLAPMAVLSAVNTNVSVLVLKKLMDLSAVGVFTSALALATSINIIQTGFNTYWAPYVFENYKGDGARRFYTVHRLMACLLTFFGLALTLLQTPVFLLLAPSYRGSVVFFPFLFLSPICYCLGETTGMGINIAKKTYWTTVIFVFSVAVNVGLCFLLVPRMGMAGAAVASAFSGVLTLLFRTAVGNRYYKVLEGLRCLTAPIALMLAASFANLLTTGALKYALLLGLTALAAATFLPEVKTLAGTAGQIVRGARARLGARRGRGRGDA